MKTIEETKSRLHEVQEKLSALEQENVRFSEARRKALEDLPQSADELRQAQRRFDQAAINAPGSKEEAEARRDLLQAREKHSLAQDRLAACDHEFGPSGAYKKIQEIGDLARRVDELQKIIWLKIADQELLELPAEAVEVARRASIARGDDCISSFVLSAMPPRLFSAAEIQDTRAKLALKYGL